MRSNVIRIESRPRKRADSIVRLSSRFVAVPADRRVVEIRTEDRFGCSEQIRREWRLTPAHHLSVEPRCLRRVWARNPGEIFATNVEGTRNLMEEAMRAGTSQK